MLKPPGVISCPHSAMQPAPASPDPTRAHAATTNRRGDRFRRGLVAADVLVLAAIISFVTVVLAFGWWRVRQAEPPPRPAPPAESFAWQPHQTDRSGS